MVVGAGIVGLCAAKVLHESGKEVLVVARELGEASRV
ncbi:MAG: NAD(P)-binding protein, partial [Meiothermus sp.]|nr:NAD(P)-binding protein [Meiothermus sp.]